MTPQFDSLVTLLKAFPDDAACRAHLERIRWDGKPKCPHCGYDARSYSVEGGSRYKCPDCRKKYTVTVGTIFDNTKVPLRKWFIAIYIATSHKKGISSVQLAKDIDVTQKTAWFMLHRIREMLREKAPQMLKGEVEVDETYIGGKEKNKPKSKRKGITGRSIEAKTPVLGMLERGTDEKPSQVVMHPVTALDRRTLQGSIDAHVEPGSRVLADEWGAYRGLSPRYGHEVVRHKDGEYVRGTVSTNGVENAWSQLKRGIVGTYHHVSRKHLHRYAAAFAFRFNTRKMGEGARFDRSLRQCAGRLKYADLTGAGV